MKKRDWLKHLGFTTAAAIAVRKIETMSKEELLKPRYKVIADYPGNVQPIGHICSVVGDMASIIYWCNQKDNYPHLFKKLEWWEERKLKEMPEFVKVIREDCAKDTGLYCKVFKWAVFDDKIPIIKGQYCAELEGYKPLYLARTELNAPGQIYGRLNATHLLPATRDEYEQYNNQQKQANDTK